MSESFLLDGGKPNVACLLQTLTQCQAPLQGGANWLDQVRDCNGPADSADGRKHANPEDPDDAAFPWEGASNCKPFTADEVINECTARDLATFWRAMLQSGLGTSEEANYAIALIEHLIFGPMMLQLDKEVELSAQHRHARGWCVLGARWVTKFGRKRHELTVKYIQALAQQLAQAAQQGQPVQDPIYAPLLLALPDPTQDAATRDLLRQWYQAYVRGSIPEKFLDRVPKLTDRQLNKIIEGLRSEAGRASVVLPYICQNEAEVVALEPYAEVVIPSTHTDVQTVLYHIEYVSKDTLEGRVVSEGYDEKWVAAVKEKAGQVPSAQLPVRAQLLGLSGLLGQASGARTGAMPLGNSATALVQLIHAVYLTTDDDGVPVAYCTTIHRDFKGGPDSNGREVPGFGKHELVETIHGVLPYTPLVREWRSRAIASSRSVQEMVSTQQKLIKDVEDQIVDRGSITIAPPVNVYESPAGVKYDFGAFAQNYIKPGKEPRFMDLPSSAGLVDGVKVHDMVANQVARRFGLMREGVMPTLMDLLAQKDARRFLAAWTGVFQHVLALWQVHGDDAEFARITGAPTGWLDGHRQQPNLLTAIFDFDVRELDPERFIEQIKAMNTVVLPNDVLGVIERGNYASWMAQSIVGPRVAKRFVRPVAAASGAMRDQAELQVLKMFAGTPPKFLDKDDPTASGLLQFTTETVMNNPKYLMALSDEALVAVAGPQAQQVAQQMPQRQPDPLFSGLLVKWLENLKFIGITQQQNKQIGRQGVAGPGQEGA